MRERSSKYYTSLVLFGSRSPVVLKYLLGEGLDDVHVGVHHRVGPPRKLELQARTVLVRIRASDAQRYQQLVLQPSRGRPKVERVLVRDEDAPVVKHLEIAPSDEAVVFPLPRAPGNGADGAAELGASRNVADVDVEVEPLVPPRARRHALGVLLRAQRVRAVVQAEFYIYLNRKSQMSSNSTFPTT